MDVSAARNIKRSNYPVLDGPSVARAKPKAALKPDAMSRSGASAQSLGVPGQLDLPGTVGQRKVYGVRSLPKVSAADITVGGKDVVKFIEGLPSAAHLRAQGVAPFLAFDADGTIWKDDFPGRLLTLAAERGMLKPEARERLSDHLRRMGLKPEETGPDRGVNRDAIRAFERRDAYMATVPPDRYKAEYDRGCEMNVNLLAGMSPKEVEGITAEVLKTARSTDVFKEIDPILDAARAKGLTPILITAGLEAVNGRFARELGFKATEIRGLRSSLDESGRYTGKLEGLLTAGEGKRLAAMEIMSRLGSPQDGRRKPVAGFGDSATHGDKALHAMSHVAFVVEPNASAAQFAAAQAQRGQNIRILDITQTRAGEPMTKYEPTRLAAH